MPSVLIIDDNAIIRQLLRLNFEQRGWQVEEARDAYEGLTRFREIAPQLVTLDLVMPLNNGIGSTQLARLILEEDSQAILLVVSSLGEEADLQEFFRKQRVEVFTKANAKNPSFDGLFKRVDRISAELEERSIGPRGSKPSGVFNE